MLVFQHVEVDTYLAIRSRSLIVYLRHIIVMIGFTITNLYHRKVFILEVYSHSGFILTIVAHCQLHSSHHICHNLYAFE